MRVGRVSVLTLIFIGTVVRVASSQSQKPLSTVVADLRTLDGAIQVRYPPGSEERAAQVQRFLAEAMPFFRSKLGAPLSFTVALLGPQEWLAWNPPNATYGDFLPGVDTTLTPPVIVLPAVRGHAVDRMLRYLWGDSEPPDGNRVSLSTALHEIGHLVAKQMGLRDPSSGWFGEFLAGYIAYVYMLEKHPEEAQFSDEVCAGMTNRIHPLHLALDQMGSGAGGADTYIWFQLSLAERQRELGRVQGWAFVEAIRTLRATDNTSLLTELESRAPGFIAWASRNHGYAPAK